ncbi:MAG: hypothetical protein GTN62_06150 [Gemmatimonadales bacterium]|nr:hypothetical protein [Gemmatimonadales bacterium]NIN11080.1 hypothetical protein [Gemmatimonadales bacterium]NIN49677.1 hypothetical protein [Gemmatimonadales bacterium]NIP07141.1 hypothetical protein [Gemmatimonadales bacterium]NIQ99532.1 hypothetical protein [Gemmatimonadales bacterium]
MSDLVPDKPRIDRGALERIIQRAAELQAAERDIGEGLTEQELMKLGQDVGIPAAYLQRALLDERTGAVVRAQPGPVAWLLGPRRLIANRTIPGQPRRIQEALNHWMTQGELLTVKRRFPDQTSWEARQDVFSTIKRGFQIGGRPYHLTPAKEIVGQVVQLDDERCHVQLVADLSNTQRSHLSGGATLAGAGAITSAIGLTLGVAVPVALIPLGLGMLVGFVAARRRLTQLERVNVAMEQVLDRLEHGEIEVPPRAGGSRPSAFARIAEEIKRTLGT